MTPDSRDHAQPSSDTPRGFHAQKPLAWIWETLFVLLVVLWAIDFFFGVHHEEIHWGSQPLFFVWYGFLSCLVLVGLAKVVAIVLNRKDDYYD